MEPQTQEEKNDQLKKAVATSNLDQCKLLLQQGADVHTENDTPIKYAAENGDTNICELLLEYGAILNDKIIRSAAISHSETCKLLLTHYKPLGKLLNNPIIPGHMKPWIQQEQNRRAAQKLRKPQPALEI